MEIFGYDWHFLKQFFSTWQQRRACDFYKGFSRGRSPKFVTF